ncbi:MAG: thioredoxin family protein [Acidobacteriota bacterium]
MIRPKRLFQSSLPVLLASVLIGVVAGPAAWAQRQTASFEIVADRASYAPGEPVRVLALVEVERGWHVNSNQPAQDYLIPTELELVLPENYLEPRLSFPPDKAYVFPFEEEPVRVFDGEFRILAELTIPPDAEAGKVPVEAVLRYQSCDDKQCLPPTSTSFPFDIEVGASGAAVAAELFVDPLGVGGEAAPAAQASADGQASRSLWVMMLLGVLGGFILNAMPCVLPVLSLKVFGLVKSAGEGRRHLTLGALATTFGILASFWLLAGAAVLASHLGAAVGWGMQFQQPAFVAALAVIIVLFSLNMWGLFEIQLPQSLAQVGGSGAREGLGGHFASGLFATLMATPCSAPFLGTAVGFALTQPPFVVVLIFTAIGVGLALPYLVLAALPQAASILPKPGAWMVTFRKVMGFLLAAAAVWLFYVLSGQISGARVAYMQLALLALAMFVWLRHDGAAGSKRFAAVGVVLSALAAVALVHGAPPAAQAAVQSSKLIDWVAFDEAEAKRLAADEGKYVFVDFTAKWCLTCKATERAVIETAPVAEAFEARSVVAMKADWTNRDDTITEFLARYDRAAVPFYILFRPGQEPHVFGELLTQEALLSAIGAS